MTPVNYLQVGIGERNPEFTIGKVYNNKDSEIPGD